MNSGSFQDGVMVFWRTSDPFNADRSQRNNAILCCAIKLTQCRYFHHVLVSFACCVTLRQSFVLLFFFFFFLRNVFLPVFLLRLLVFPLFSFCIFLFISSLPCPPVFFILRLQLLYESSPLFHYLPALVFFKAFMPYPNMNALRTMLSIHLTYVSSTWEVLRNHMWTRLNSVIGGCLLSP